MRNLTKDELIKLVEKYKFDELTGLMQRKDMYEYAMSLSGKYYISMVDLDNLHTINRALGMDAGDIFIKSTANSLVHYFGKDKVFRYGGDEFIIIHQFHDADYVLKSIDNISFATVKYDKSKHSNFGDVFKEVDSLLISVKCGMGSRCDNSDITKDKN